MTGASELPRTLDPGRGHGDDHRARTAAGRRRERLGPDTRRVHPRPLAAPEQLGPLGGVFEEAGYATLTPGWPDDPETVEEAKAHPEVFAHKTVGQVADHFADLIDKLTKKPAVIGHSFGGLLTQIIAGRGLAAASVAIDPAPFRGVLPLADLVAQVGVARAGQPRQPQPGRPAHLRAVPLRVRQRRQRGGGQRALREFAVPASGAPLFQAATANLNPWTEAKVDTKNPDRGPLLIISGEKDNTVPGPWRTRPSRSRSATKA